MDFFSQVYFANFADQISQIWKSCHARYVQSCMHKIHTRLSCTPDLDVCSDRHCRYVLSCTRYGLLCTRYVLSSAKYVIHALVYTYKICLAHQMSAEIIIADTCSCIHCRYGLSSARYMIRVLVCKISDMYIHTRYISHTRCLLRSSLQIRALAYIVDRGSRVQDMCSHLQDM